MSRLHWPSVVAEAARLAGGHSARYGPPTLRRVHYLLVSDPAAVALGYRNTQGHYKTLSARTTALRWAGLFPALTDGTRTVHQPVGHVTGAGLAEALAQRFAYERGRHAPAQVLVLAEKRGVVPMLRQRFPDVHVSAMAGYPSVSHLQGLNHLADTDTRDTVALYVGDFDPSGLDIPRAIAERATFPLRVLGLTWEQVTERRLPPMPAKGSDSRTAGMAAQYGQAVQVELDAMPAEVLLDLVGDALAEEGGLVDASTEARLAEQETEVRHLFADLSTALLERGA